MVIIDNLAELRGAITGKLAYLRDTSDGNIYDSGYVDALHWVCDLMGYEVDVVITGDNPEDYII